MSCSTMPTSMPPSRRSHSAAFINQGQVCMSTERVIVDEAVAASFVDKLAKKTAALPAGDPRSGPVVIGSMIDEAPAKHVVALIDDAIAKGAVKLAGGDRVGTVVPATVLDRVVPGMRIYTEESFGPVVSVIRASGVDDAVRLANDTEYGLSAAVFGRDVARADGGAADRKRHLPRQRPDRA
ncbi:acyl-CoA reductase-like NAD-dependent aldehyde dehydrogenase [Bradyrhizobium sp. GM22.5]